MRIRTLSLLLLVWMTGVGGAFAAEDSKDEAPAERPPRMGLEQDSEPVARFCEQLVAAILSNKIDAHCQVNEVSVADQTIEIFVYLSGGDMTPRQAANTAFGTLVNVATRFPEIAGYELQRLRLQAAQSEIRWMLAMSEVERCNERSDSPMGAMACMIRAKQEM